MSYLSASGSVIVISERVLKAPRGHTFEVYRRVLNLSPWVTVQGFPGEREYPTSGQERGLVRNPHLNDHIFDTEYGTALILGCHDLTIFNPRSQSNAEGWRKNVATEWRDLVKNAKPTFALHHPHTTVKARTWLAAWNQLHKELPSVKLSLGSGCYSSRDNGWNKRDCLPEVLGATKHGQTLDILVHLGTLEQ